MGKKWSDEEIELLSKNYANMDINELFNLFNGNRSKGSIDNKASELKLKKFNGNIKEGFQVCKKCNRELPWDFKHFPVLASETNPRRICRECNPKYGKFLNDDYKKKVFWNKEDDKLFIERYPNYTNEELRRLFYNDLTDKQLTDKAFRVGVVKSEDTYWRGRKQQAPKTSAKLKGRIISEEHRRKLSEIKKKQFAEGVYVSHWIGRIVSEEEKQKTRERVKGKWKGEKNPRFKKPLFGEENGRWNGGITAISTALRENIYEWKKESMEQFNYKCILTGREFDNIHHLTPFNNIVKECVEELGLDFLSSLGEYCDSDRENLIKLLQYKHKVYGLGVCLHKDVHKLFHDTYSYIKFSPDDFKDFAKKYFNGEFDEKLKDELKSVNSKRNLEEVKKLASFYYLEN